LILFSIVIPVYKDFERLQKCLSKVSNQRFPKNIYEVLVINNNPDNDLIIENIFPFYIEVLNEKKPGSYAARNTGIKKARGEIIAFTDSDMLPDLNWLETASAYFSKDHGNEIGILTGPVPMFYKNPEKLSPAEIYEKYTGFDFESYAKEGACGAGNWFSYKSVLEEFGGFREDLKSNGDTELSLRISKKYQVVYVPELINRHPARYTIEELVFRYRRILGGTYQRKYQGNKKAFLGHTLNFIFRRYRFALKKFFTVSIRESWAIFNVCNAINWGAWKEYIHLINGGDSKR